LASLRAQLIASLDEVLSLEWEWAALLGGSDVRNPFLTWEWLSSWLLCFGEDNQPWFITVRDPSGSLVGVAPFVRWTRFRRGVPVREVGFAGAGRAAPDHLDLVARAGAEPAVADAVLAYLHRSRLRFDVMRCEGTRADAALVVRLMRDVRPSHRLVDEEVCPYARLPASWDEYLARRRTGMRKELRRRARRLAEDHPTTVLRRVDDEAALEPAMDSLVSLHSARFPPSGGAFGEPGFERFHRLVARRFLGAGWLRLYLLQVEGRDVAAKYGFSYGGRFWSYISGYDPSLAHYSLSSQLHAHAIREAIEEGLGEFDFLRGDEPYKRDWADGRRVDLNLTIPARADVWAVVLALRLLRRSRNRRAG
jgi:CelD/BcsL family acetyltransferase involved in cellulose biosynthesis